MTAPAAPEMPTTPVAGMDDPRWEALRAPFDDDVLEWKPQPMKATPKDREERRQASGRCVRGGHALNGDAISADDFYCGGYHVRAVHIAYVGHAELTMRLNDVCSPVGWDWEPVGVDDRGWPIIQNGGMWIRLTILGTTKVGFGDWGDNSGANGVKELIGDALRNAAMRFGIATYLWSKSERSLALKYADAAEKETTAPQQQQQPQQRQERQQDRPATQQAQQEPNDFQKATARHRAAIARAHPEWDADAQRQAVTNAFAAERTDGDGKPLAVENATADDWNWMAQAWEDEADDNEAAVREQELQQREDDEHAAAVEREREAQAEADAAESAPEQPADEHASAVSA